jgi:hypothetical protein
MKGSDRLFSDIACYLKAPNLFEKNDANNCLHRQGMMASHEQTYFIACGGGIYHKNVPVFSLPKAKNL